MCWRSRTSMCRSRWRCSAAAIVGFLVAAGRRPVDAAAARRLFRGLHLRPHRAHAPGHQLVGDQDQPDGVALIFTDVSNVTIYEMLLAVALITMVGSWYVSRSRLGYALRAIGEDETVARHTGINTTRVKVLCFALSASVMALVGAVLALRYPYIDASIAFNNTWSFQVLIAALLGGPAAPGGRRSARCRWCCCRNFSPAPSRIISASRSACASSSSSISCPAASRRAASSARLALAAAPWHGQARRQAWRMSARWRELTTRSCSASGLRKAFGGLVAVRDISFDIPRGGITGLIGPNGSGKTTVLNLITGELPPDRRLDPASRARTSSAGRSFRSLPRAHRPHLPARARAAGHDGARKRHARPHVRQRPGRRRRRPRTRPTRCSSGSGLAGARICSASQLTYIDQKRVELARALATRPAAAAARRMAGRPQPDRTAGRHRADPPDPQATASPSS